MSEQSWGHCPYEGFVYVLRVLSSAAHGDRKTLNSRFDNVHSRPILVPGCQRILPDFILYHSEA